MVVLLMRFLIQESALHMIRLFLTLLGLGLLGLGLLWLVLVLLWLLVLLVLVLLGLGLVLVLGPVCPILPLLLLPWLLLPI
jgi:hypothetical protein